MVGGVATADGPARQGRGQRRSPRRRTQGGRPLTEVSEEDGRSQRDCSRTRSAFRPGGRNSFSLGPACKNTPSLEAGRLGVTAFMTPIATTGGKRCDDRHGALHQLPIGTNRSISGHRTRTSFLSRAPWPGKVRWGMRPRYYGSLSRQWAGIRPCSLSGSLGPDRLAGPVMKDLDRSPREYLAHQSDCPLVNLESGVMVGNGTWTARAN